MPLMAPSANSSELKSPRSTCSSLRRSHTSQTSFSSSGTTLGWLGSTLGIASGGALLSDSTPDAPLSDWPAGTLSAEDGTGVSRTSLKHPASTRSASTRQGGGRCRKSSPVKHKLLLA